jgi:predicted RecB family nuclease
MSAKKITSEVLEAFLHCKLKAHLKEAGEQGTRTDYEALLSRRDDLKQAAIQKILAAHGEDQVARSITLTADELKSAPLFVLDALYEDDLFCLKIDGLKRVPGASALGPFHYLPMLFRSGEKIGREERLVLELHGLLLAGMQGLAPSHGIVWHGKECRGTRVALRMDRAEQLLRQLRRTQDSEPPKLVLNDHCQMCEYRQRCHDQAVKEDSLSLLRGMNDQEIRKRARRGIFTLAQLAHTFRPRRKAKKDLHKPGKRQHALHAMAVRDRKVYVLGSPAIPAASARIYLDVEGKPDESFVYLIGMLVVRGGVEERHSFWADSKEQEQAAFEHLLAEASRHEPFVMFCYGGYELAFLRRMKKQASNKEAVDRLLGSVVNVLSVVYSHLYFPCHANGLKDIAGFLGCTWSEPDASGLQSLVWRARWEETGDETWRRKLCIYNQEDCTALRKVTEFIGGVAERADLQAGAARPGEGSPVVRVQDLKDYHPPARSWGPIQFVHPDFEHVNSCAYFDYQRQRVYVRSSEAIRRSQRRSSGSRNRKMPCNRYVTLTGSGCPSCQGHGVVSGVPRQEATCPVPRLKRAFDLVLTASGIRRRVTHCRSSVHKCLSCGSMFVPEEHQRLDKHFHGLKAWAMYQHVAHRLELGAISTMIEEFFGVRVFSGEMLMIK